MNSINFSLSTFLAVRIIGEPAVKKVNSVSSLCNDNLRTHAIRDVTNSPPTYGIRCKRR